MRLQLVTKEEQLEELFLANQIKPLKKSDDKHQYELHTEDTPNETISERLKKIITISESVARDVESGRVIDAQDYLGLVRNKALRPVLKSVLAAHNYDLFKCAHYLSISERTMRNWIKATGLKKYYEHQKKVIDYDQWVRDNGKWY